MKRWLAITAVSLLLILFVYPSAFIYPKDTLPDSNDTRLIAYIIGQIQENIITEKPLFFGRFFAPDQNTLAYSEPFLTSSLLTLPFRLFTDHPILIFNLAFILGFLLTILSSFLLFEYLFQNTYLATLTTVLFNFSGFHLHYYPHLQMFSLWPLLLSVYFFLRFQDENKTKFLILFLLSCTAQLAESIFPFYLIFFTVFILLWRKPSQFPKIILQLLFVAPLWLALVSPYLNLHHSFPEATRPIRDSAHFSLGLEEIFIKYHSWTVIFLFFLSVAVRFLYEKKWLSIFLFSLVMSLGPVLKIFGHTVKIFGLPIPLPYTAFYYLFPGFTGFRTPSRFIILALLCAVVIIGLQLKLIFEKLKTKTKAIFIALVLSLLFLEADLPLKGYPVNINTHPVYEQVKALPAEAVILELPIRLWNMPDHEIESIRSLYSLEHKHRRFGGFSGFATNSWINLVEKINAHGLNEENTSKLKSLGVTHVIENNRLYPLP